MGIKLLKATEYPLYDPNEELIGSTITVEIDIDGRKWSVGGIDPTWDKPQILIHLESRREEMLADIQKDKSTEAIERIDLIDGSPRDLCTEIDELKERINTLEKAKVMRL